MNPIADLWMALGAMLLGVVIGWKAGRAWGLVYLVALMACLAIALVTRWPQASEWTGLGWTAEPRWRAWIAAMLIPGLLLAPTHRMDTRRRQRLLAGATVLSVAAGLVPLFSALAVSDRLLAMATRLGPDRICRQQTDFTCGPAAAVTALRRLGVSADEGALAMVAGTTPVTGTSVESLAHALKQRIAGSDISVRVRKFRTVEELTGAAGPVLVVIRYGFMTDHWVTVLGVGPWGVEVADPNSGHEVWDRAEFDAKLRGIGVELARN